MSIRKRLILSNIGMVLIPVLSLLLVEIIAGYIFFYLYNGKPEGRFLQLFLTARFAAMIVILMLTNAILTYLVSKSIIGPIKKLSAAARKISEGDLEHSVKSDSRDELGQLSNTFEEMRLKLREAESMQKQYERNRQELIASISHDLKTPLTSIKGYVSGIQDGIARTPEKLERYMDRISRNANDMDALIDELFLYSKLDLEQAAFHFEKVRLDSFFADFLDELSFKLEKENGHAELIAGGEGSFTVEADREKLKRVVLNITQNSLNYMNRTHKRIQIRLYSSPEEVEVEIRDNGSGIGKEELSRIFDSFYRTDASRNSTTGGSGLGLSIARKIIEGHGGRIWAASEPGEGTSIHFTLKKVSK